MIDKKDIFNDIEKHLMEDEKPSEYLNQAKKDGTLDDSFPFNMLTALVKTEQSPTHHPEGSVWNHTLMVVDEASQRKHLSEEPRAFMWAALLHDIGKAPTTKLRKGKITSYDHDKVGAEMADEFLRVFTENEDFIKRVTVLVRWHMQLLFVVKDLPFADIRTMASESSIEEIALLSICDRFGRGLMDDRKKTEEQNNIDTFLKKCREFLEKKNEKKK